MPLRDYGSSSHAPYRYAFERLGKRHQRPPSPGPDDASDSAASTEPEDLRSSALNSRPSSILSYGKASRPSSTISNYRTSDESNKADVDAAEAVYFSSFSDEDLGDREDDWDGASGYKPVGSVRARALYDRLEDYKPGRRTYSMRELLKDKWLYVVDNEFPLGLTEIMDEWRDRRSLHPTTSFCSDCHSRRVLLRCLKSENEKHDLKVAKLRRSAGSCMVCDMVLGASENLLSGDQKVQIYRYCSMLKLVKHKWDDTKDVPFLTICADPDRKRHLEDLQIGLPVLLTPGTAKHFALLREWLRVCDNDHKNLGCHASHPSILPTRVLDIGSRSDFGDLKLYCSKKNEPGSYVALSHCWGKLPPGEREKSCTYTANFDARCKGIDLRDLPKTFREALQVVRELGQRYIWIDSLCIIQDDLADWEKEAKTMETVYSMAYCTLAATSAVDSTEGLFRPRQPRKFLKFENLKNEPHYLCEMIDDFHGGVETSVLNSRGWVLQERGLSRRIIHFAERQTYWECGIGVHCESLTTMYNKQAYLLGDPQFPNSISMATDAENMIFFQSLFTKYTELGLTKGSDRPPAVAGLERRLATALSTQIRYGIVEKFLHRSLLWKRGSPAEKLARIMYAEHRKVPAWSWMAYTGSIDYLSPHLEQVKWEQHVEFPSGAILTVRITALKNSTIEEGDIVVNNKGQKKGDLIFDQAAVDAQSIQLAILGRHEWYARAECECFVLLLRRTSEHTYERVGVGTIQSSVISFESGDYGQVV